jgi:hypothetical protein
VTDESTPDELRDRLAQYYGTEAYHRWSPLFGNALLTDGAKALAEGAGAYWLMDMIASHLPSAPKNKTFCIARLTLDMTGGATFTLSSDLDEGEPIDLYATQIIEYTDFPLPEGVVLYAQHDGEKWIIMLRSEY